ncbi:hypothetical protein [Vineibacter terrae]|uniref:hypothetical protein n=1 Tax=Vineibacter terrae TaxID=2586908 RepID=UPI002E311A6D|nr:hypothetical protein [Vineibacter terrae]HEX2887176.1 hypothetical protein [Vineibacter terrae]
MSDPMGLLSTQPYDPAQLDPLSALSRYHGARAVNALVNTVGMEPIYKPQLPLAMPAALRPHAFDGADVLSLWLESTPIAAVRDGVKAYKDFLRSWMADDSTGMVSAAADGALAAASFTPYGKAGKAARPVAKAVAPHLREFVEAATKFNPRGLPMDLASRHARAAAMGFDMSQRFFHATDRTFKFFDPKKGGEIEATFFSSSPHVADSYIGMDGVPMSSEADDFAAAVARIMPNAPRQRQYAPGEQMYDVVFRDLDKFKVVDYSLPGRESYEVTIRKAKEEGYPGVIFRNMGDAGPAVQDFDLPKAQELSTVVALIDPSYARSPRATFDPKKKHSKDLLSNRLPRGGVGLLTPHMPA